MSSIEKLKKCQNVEELRNFASDLKVSYGKAGGRSFVLKSDKKGAVTLNQLVKQLAVLAKSKDYQSTLHCADLIKKLSDSSKREMKKKSCIFKFFTSIRQAFGNLRFNKDVELVKIRKEAIKAMPIEKEDPNLALEEIKVEDKKNKPIKKEVSIAEDPTPKATSQKGQRKFPKGIIKKENEKKEDSNVSGNHKEELAKMTAGEPISYQILNHPIGLIESSFFAKFSVSLLLYEMSEIKTALNKMKNDPEKFCYLVLCTSQHLRKAPLSLICDLLLSLEWPDNVPKEQVIKNMLDLRISSSIPDISTFIKTNGKNNGEGDEFPILQFSYHTIDFQEKDKKTKVCDAVKVTLFLDQIYGQYARIKTKQEWPDAVVKMVTQVVKDHLKKIDASIKAEDPHSLSWGLSLNIQYKNDCEVKSSIIDELICSDSPLKTLVAIDLTSLPHDCTIDKAAEIVKSNPKLLYFQPNMDLPLMEEWKKGRIGKVGWRDIRKERMDQLSADRAQTVVFKD